MEEKKNEIVVFTMDVNHFPNEYTERLNRISTECIKVDPFTCVYRKWEGTRYSMDSMPTAHIFE